MYGSSISVFVQICSSFTFQAPVNLKWESSQGATNETPGMGIFLAVRSGGTAVYLVFVRNGDFPHSRQAAFELDVIIPQNGHILNSLVAGAVRLRTLQTIVKSNSSVTADQRNTIFTLIAAMNLSFLSLERRAKFVRDSGLSGRVRSSQVAPVSSASRFHFRKFASW